jgi:Putative transposase
MLNARTPRAAAAINNDVEAIVGVEDVVSGHRLVPASGKPSQRNPSPLERIISKSSLVRWRHHRVAISNRRLVALNDKGVTFKWKDYRLEGRERYGLMTLDTHEFIRRFLMHVSAQGFHRIRYYGLLTSPTPANNIARIRALLAVSLIPIDAIKVATTKPEELKPPDHSCPCCGSRMRIIETFLPGQQPKHRATPLPVKIRIDTS